ncbi:hypothetical protein PAXRUDRAFT_827664 [Paxillus rubicundulus Ve08.2h10]|uniref:Uncharacterized protein n=1 Tax=Paxillus rubicundulus Ve08.2h10 TaxID=930991 RepID=A0A0D0DQL4_9AGAM|nr:hypothetical protein PAXRUDRAFT_827664 [Paxillus rubicundulus Ve08.2h10]
MVTTLPLPRKPRFIFTHFHYIVGRVSDGADGTPVISERITRVRTYSDEPYWGIPLWGSMRIRPRNRRARAWWWSD